MRLGKSSGRRSRSVGAPIVRYIATLLAVALAYFVLAKLGLELASINPSASPIWAPSGIALAAVLLGGLRIWPAILVGAFAANATTAGTLETSAVIAVGNTLEAVVGGFLIGHWAGGAQDLPHAGAGGEIRACWWSGRRPSISASVGVVTLCVAGFAAWQNFAPIWVTWWLGDAAGALVVTPVIVLWAQSDRRAFDRSELGPLAGDDRGRGRGRLHRLQPAAAALANIQARSASWRSCRWSGRRCGAARATPRPSA